MAYPNPYDEPHTARPKRRDLSDNPFYLPVWSVTAILVLVIAVVGGGVSLLLLLGGAPPRAIEPQVILLTAPPTAPRPDDTAMTPDAPIPGVIFGGAAPAEGFALAGPTLPSIRFTPTPLLPSIDAIVNVSENQVRIRRGPGTDQQEIGFAYVGERYLILDGPRQATSLTWWRVQRVDNPSLTGWIAGIYLQVEVNR